MLGIVSGQPPSAPYLTSFTTGDKAAEDCPWLQVWWDLNTCTLRMWLCMKWHCKLVHGCMEYTEHARRRQQLHVAPAMQRPNNTVSTPLAWIFKNALYKATVTSSESHATRVQWVWSEQRIALYKKRSTKYCLPIDHNVMTFEYITDHSHRKVRSVVCVCH